MSESKKKFAMDWPLTIVSLIVVFTFVFFTAKFPDQSMNGMTSAFNWVTGNLGSPLMICTLITTIISIYFVFGKYKDIKLGEGPPEYSTVSYVAMMTLAAFASAAMYWSFTEWGYYYMEPGILLEPYSVAAAEAALGYSFYHWGLMEQGYYVVAGVAIAYAVYNRGVKFMRVSAVCESMMGNFKYKKFVGKLIDFSVIFCIVGALGTSLGLAVPLGTGGLKQVFGIESTFGVQVAVVVFIGIVFTITSFLGTKKGMQYLSNGSSAICILLLIFILVVGPTAFIIKNIVSSFGWMFNEYIRISTFTDPIAQSGFPEGWTMFFQCFTLNYTAMMGIFIAKISKGRTIKQVTLACMLGVSGGVWALFGVNTGFALNAELNGTYSVVELLKSGAGQDGIYGLIEAALPGGKVLIPVIFMIVVVGFVASSLDSASFSLAQTATVAVDSEGDVSKAQRIFWCVILTLVPLVMMFVNAPFNALKQLTIIVAMPFLIVVMFMTFKLLRWLKDDTKAEEKLKNEMFETWKKENKEAVTAAQELSS